MKKTLFIIVFLIPSFLILAQDANSEFYRHQIGINAGPFTGIGLSYRYWPAKAGLQITFIPYKNDRNDNYEPENRYLLPFSPDEFPKGTFISAGLTGFLQIKKFENISMFTYLGNHLLITDHANYYNIGGGIGFAFLTTLSFNLNIGYGAYDVSGTFFLLPAIELGLHYRIKNRK